MTTDTVTPDPSSSGLPSPAPATTATSASNATAAAPTASSAPPGPPPASAGAVAPLQGTALIVGAVALSLGTFMNVLDSSIANVSLPTISGDLGVSADQGTWVITSFGVANAVSVPLTGWLTQRYGQVRLFTLSTILFVVASVLCGLANSLGMLILFRIIQGAVAGPMIPLSQALLLSSYPKHKAGTALAIWSITTLVAPVTGPLLGGWISDNISWPWIFYINIPFGLFAAGATWAIYRKRESATRKLPIDAVGLALLVVWVGALQVLLDKGRELDWFGSREIIILAVVAAVGFIVFFIWEMTDKHPVVDLRLFAKRNFWAGTLALSLAYGTFFGNIVLLPLWLQQHMGYTATLAGVVLAPVGILAIILTPVVGKTLNRVDPRIFATIAFAVFAVVFFMRSHFNTDADFRTIMIPTVIQGIAMACFFPPLISLTISGLTPDRIPSASGLTNFARITAGSFGTSIATTVWFNRASLHHSQLAEHITPGNPAAAQALSNLQNLGMSGAQSSEVLNRIIDQQAFMLSANDVFFYSSVIFVLLIGVIWFARPARASAVDPSVTSAAH